MSFGHESGLEKGIRVIEPRFCEDETTLLPSTREAVVRSG